MPIPTKCFCHQPWIDTTWGLLQAVRGLFGTQRTRQQKGHNLLQKTENRLPGCPNILGQEVNWWVTWKYVLFRSSGHFKSQTFIDFQDFPWWSYRVFTSPAPCHILLTLSSIHGSKDMAGRRSVPNALWTQLVCTTEGTFPWHVRMTPCTNLWASDLWRTDCKANVLQNTLAGCTGILHVVHLKKSKGSNILAIHSCRCSPSLDAKDLHVLVLVFWRVMHLHLQKSPMLLDSTFPLSRWSWDDLDGLQSKNFL